MAAFGLATAAFAGDFDLNSLSAADLKASQEEMPAAQASAPVQVLPAKAPAVNKAPNMPAPVLDMTVRLPFKDISERLTGLSGAYLQVIDPSAPILSRQGDTIVFGNVTVNYNGMEVEPALFIKPFFEGDNRLAIKVMKVEADVVLGPKAALGKELDKDGLMEMVMTKLSAGVLEAVDKAFLANKVPLKAGDVLAFSYDRASWTLHAAIAPGFVAPLLPGLISNINLTAFTFDDLGFSLAVKSGSAASVVQLPGSSLAVSDGLLDNFILQFTKGTDFELHPAGHEGGLKFRADGVLEMAGKIYARDVFLKPNVYFKVVIRPEVTAPNTIKARIERVDVDQAYGIGVPGFINGWIQGKVIRSVIDTLTTNPALSKVMTARKLDDKTVEITLKNSAILPSFAKGAVINDLKIVNGLVCIGFEL